MRTDLDYGERLVSVTMPPRADGRVDQWHVRDAAVREITVGRIPGSEAYVLTAQITFEDQRPDIIIPLYRVERLEVQYGD